MEHEERVIIVDDELTITKLCWRVLKDDGYQVESFTDPTVALDRAQTLAATDDRVDLLLTDILMPKMHGPELAKSVRLIFPMVQVVFMTGLDKDSLAQYQEQSGGEIHSIGKPFCIHELTNQVRQLLKI